MLTDPQSITISGTTVSLPVTQETQTTRTYASFADGVTLYVSQQTDKKGTRRSTASLVKETVVTDALSGLSKRVSPSATVTFSIPQGASQTDVVDLFSAISTALSASTNALAKRVVAGER